jgi:hypothetical protein
MERCDTKFAALQNFLTPKISQGDLTISRIFDWLIIRLLFILLRIFHSYLDVTIAGLQSLTYA